MPSDNVQVELQYITILRNTIGNTSYLVARVVDLTQTYVYTGWFRKLTTNSGGKLLHRGDQLVKEGSEDGTIGIPFHRTNNTTVHML